MKKIFFLLSILFIALFSSAQQLAPTITWQKCLGGSRDDKANVIIRTPDNGLLIAGSSLSNDGDVSGHHGSSDSTDAWVVKLSSTGNILWQKSMGGSGKDNFTSAIVTSDGGYLCMGTTTSSDGDVTGWHGREDIWMVKFTRNGDVVWKKCLGGSSIETPGNIKQNQDGTIYFIGTTWSSDGDVTYNFKDLFGQNNTQDIWVIKLSSNGNLIWQKSFGGEGGDLGYDIVEAENGRFIIAAENYSNSGNLGPSGSGSNPNGNIFKISVGFDKVYRLPLFGQSPRQIHMNGNDIYVTCANQLCRPIQYNISTNTLRFTNRPTDSLNPPTTSAVASFRTCRGQFDPAFNYLPGIGSHNNISGNNLYALTSLDSVGNTGFYGGGFLSSVRDGAIGNAPSWKRFIGGSDRSTNLIGILPLNEFEFMVGGYTQANDRDVSGNHGGYDFWIVKMGQINFIKGSVYLDYNVNSVKDANEPFLNNILVQSIKDTLKSATLSYKGVFGNVVDTGTYQTSVISSIPYYTAVPNSRTSVLTAYNTSDSLSFAFQPIPNKRNYSLYPFATTIVRPGFDVGYKIQCVNLGTDTLVNRTVKMIKSNKLSFLSSMPTQSAVSGDTIIWTIPFLSPRDTSFITIQCKAAAPPSLNIRDTIINYFSIDSTGDLEPSNNYFKNIAIAFGAYDPNDKQESKSGSFTTKELTDKQYLQYTIRFQNTGNDTAFNISVRDTLDAKLDWTTVEMISASHPYQLSIKNGNQLNWTFDNILLVDSIRNEPLSHGYIVYRVKPKSTLQAGDIISNSASIYFDFNLPVKTNTQLTTIKNAPPSAPVISGLQNNYCSNKGVQKGKVNNPEPGAVTVVKIDAVATPLAADSSFSFDVSAMTAGVHTVSVVSTNTGGSDSTKYAFNVLAASIPDVNVTSTITNIINLSDAVVITANNASGGGALPLFTFAKDRTFTNILQTESSTNSLTLQPASFTIGSNWIYVRMKTSDACYSAQANIDSIEIRRSAVTGVVDVDNPGLVIIAYPNPFKQIINISGLNAGKSYTVVIANVKGQEIYREKIRQRNSFSISNKISTTGNYWLTVYDDKKNRIIGSIALIRE